MDDDLMKRVAASVAAFNAMSPEEQDAMMRKQREGYVKAEMSWPTTTTTRERWTGIFKVLEEMGELNQVLGKIGAFPDGTHPSGIQVREKLIEELADLEAALEYFIMHNLSDDERRAVLVRYGEKLQKFNFYKMTGV